MLSETSWWLFGFSVRVFEVLTAIVVVYTIRMLRREAREEAQREPRYLQESRRLGAVVAQRLAEAHAVSAPTDEVAREVEEALRPELRAVFAPPGAAA